MVPVFFTAWQHRLIRWVQVITDKNGIVSHLYCIHFIGVFSMENWWNEYIYLRLYDSIFLPTKKKSFSSNWIYLFRTWRYKILSNTIGVHRWIMSCIALHKSQFSILCQKKRKVPNLSIKYMNVICFDLELSVVNRKHLRKTYEFPQERGYTNKRQS